VTRIERQLYVQAWATSVTLHGIAVTLAVLLVSQIKPLALQETFQWNVSLVETPKEQSVEPRVKTARPPAPAPHPQVQPMQPVTTTPHVVLQEVQTRQPNPVITVEERQPLLEAPKAMERLAVQAVAQSSMVQQQPIVTQTLPSVKEVAHAHEAERVERLPESVVQSVVPAKQPSAVYLTDNEPALRSATTVGAPMAKAKDSVVMEQVAAAVNASSPLERAEPVVEATRDNQLSQVATVPRESMAPPRSSELAQPMTRGVQQAPTTRADYGWLIESIGKRLAELKRYPPTARLNGWEGKVLLRAVVRADGQLAEVQVQKSSGHEELDTAAMETVREASPLRLRHELGRPQIVITVPLVYSLAQ
jgi:protein TonB